MNTNPEISEAEQVMRDSTATAVPGHPILGNVELKVIECVRIVEELDTLRQRIAELEGARAKDAMELADLREIADNARAAIVEVFGDGAPLWSPADAIRSLGRMRKEQAAELERLRRFETHARAADDEEYVGETCEELRKAVRALDEAVELAAAQPSGERTEP